MCLPTSFFIFHVVVCSLGPSYLHINFRSSFESRLALLHQDGSGNFLFLRSLRRSVSTAPLLCTVGRRRGPASLSFSLSLFPLPLPCAVTRGILLALVFLVVQSWPMLSTSSWLSLFFQSRYSQAGFVAQMKPVQHLFSGLEGFLDVLSKLYYSHAE